MALFLAFIVAPWSLVHLGGAGVAGFTPHIYRTRGYGGVPIAGHARWAEVGGGIICVTLGEFSGVHKVCASYFQVIGSN